MENKLHMSLDKIHADAALKARTADYLQKEISKRSRTGWFFRQRFAVICASFAILLVAGGFSYFTPDAYVDMDVNPSIALTLNRFGRVLEAVPYNDDGAAILQDTKVRYKSCEQAVELLLSEMLEQGYLKEDGLVSVTIQTQNDSEEQLMLGKIQASVDKLLTSHHSEAASDIFAVTEEIRDCAHDYNLSPAKYLAITRLQEVDPSASYDKCAEHSISEINQLTEEHCGEHQKQKSERRKNHEHNRQKEHHR